MCFLLKSRSEVQPKIISMAISGRSTNSLAGINTYVTRMGTSQALLKLSTLKSSLSSVSELETIISTLPSNTTRSSNIISTVKYCQVLPSTVQFPMAARRQKSQITNILDVVSFGEAQMMLHLGGTRHCRPNQCDSYMNHNKASYVPEERTNLWVRAIFRILSPIPLLLSSALQCDAGVSSETIGRKGNSTGEQKIPTREKQRETKRNKFGQNEAKLVLGKTLFFLLLSPFLLTGLQGPLKHVESELKTFSKRCNAHP